MDAVPLGYAALDPALERLAESGPDLRNGLTSHAPMVVEALCALDRAAAVPDWLAGYEALLMPWPDPRTPIDGEAWRDALGDSRRAADWRTFFAAELAAMSWPEVVARWTPRLSPGFVAAAAHGVIRVGHAVRALSVDETPARRRELGDAFASWAYALQTLPTTSGAPVGRPGEAIRTVPLLPAERRRAVNTIVEALEALNEVPGFAAVIDAADLTGDPAATLSELTETFARVYLANVRDVLTSIVFVHGITGPAAVRPLLPYLDADTARDVLRYAWQASCALYAAFGTAPPVDDGRCNLTPADLVDRAIAGGDEHAIKVTEVCLREHAVRPSDAYLAVATDAVARLG